MPVVDYEGVVLDLKTWLVDCAGRGKRSLGQREVVEKIAELEVRRRLPEGQECFDDRPMPGPRGAPRSGASEPAHDEPVPTGAA